MQDQGLPVPVADLPSSAQSVRLLGFSGPFESRQSALLVNHYRDLIKHWSREPVGVAAAIMSHTLAGRPHDDALNVELGGARWTLRSDFGTSEGARIVVLFSANQQRIAFYVYGPTGTEEIENIAETMLRVMKQLSGQPVPSADPE